MSKAVTAGTGHNKVLSAIVILAAVLLAGIVLEASGRPAPAQAGTGAPTAPLAGDKYKNIKVLNKIPAAELIPSMQFITGALGVECAFCHVESSGKLDFEKDDKKEKKVAREMMQMMFAINKNNFEGEREVTCNTCHRGSPQPQAIPAILAQTPTPEGEPEHHHDMDPASLPSGDPVLAKYLQALGGQAALAKVTTRVQKGKTLMPEGPPIPIEIYTKAPDQRVSVMRSARGENVTAYNGQVGWISSPGRPVHAMSASDQVAARLDAQSFYPNFLQQQFSELKLQHDSEKVGDQETDVVLGLAKGQPPVKFYFDKASGLLLRMVHYTDTPLGLNPTQVDYADYRSVDGVKTPYRWTIARPSGAFTIQLDEVQQNVPIDAARFVEPPPSPTQGTMPQGPKPPQGATPPTAPAPPSGSM